MLLLAVGECRRHGTGRGVARPGAVLPVQHVGRRAVGINGFGGRHTRSGGPHAGRAFRAAGGRHGSCVGCGAHISACHAYRHRVQHYLLGLFNGAGGQGFVFQLRRIAAQYLCIFLHHVTSCVWFCFSCFQCICPFRRFPSAPHSPGSRGAFLPTAGSSCWWRTGPAQEAPQTARRTRQIRCCKSL